MRKVFVICMVLLCAANVAAWLLLRESPKETIKVETITRTIVKVDTLMLVAPCTPLYVLELSDTIRIGDTIVQREQAVYEDSLYKAYVSGYRPRLDSIELYPRTQIVTVTNDVYHTTEQRRKRWGLGLQAGYGYPNGAYVGVGVSYNIWGW